MGWQRSFIKPADRLGSKVPRPWGGIGLGAGLFVVATQACAQMDAVLTQPPVGTVANSYGLDSGSTGSRGFSLQPRVQTDFLFTDNIRLQSDKRADFVATVQPGIRLISNGSRLKANVDYSLSYLQHAREQSLNTTQNNLLANGRFEAIENFAFIDFDSTITQQAISAFGAQSDSNTSSNSNRTEYSTFRVSPNVRGRFGDWATYLARYSRQLSRTKSGSTPNQTVDDISAQIAGDSQRRAVNWSVNVSRQIIDYSSGLSYEADRVRSILGYPITPQLIFAVIPGWESNNFLSTEKESTYTLGSSVDWRLSERTKFNALVEKRFFGRAYVVAFEHRTGRTAWRFSDSRDASATPSASGTVGLGSIYDLLLLQFSSIEPDAARRALLVESYMRANGLDRNTQVRTGFLASSAMLSQRRELSFTLLGVRDTLSFIASQSRSSRLSQLTTALDDLATASAVRQRALSAIYSRRLTPEATFNASASMLRTTGDLASQSSTLTSLNVTMSTRLTDQMSASVGLRHARFSSETIPYTENAILAGLSVRF